MGETLRDMLQKLDEFKLFTEAQLRIHPTKFHFVVNRVKFLEHVFDQRGISVDVLNSESFLNFQSQIQ